MTNILLEEGWSRLVGSLEQLPHALLIHGPRGVGKLVLARRFSQLLLCESPAARVPCGRCDGCRWFAEGNHPDFRLVQPEILTQDAESGDEPPELEQAGKKSKPSIEIRVGQVRELGDFLYIGSHRGARRVALIHPAEAMNTNAANALLKALEEPPANAIFILVSHEPARLLATVCSRCVRIGVPVPDRRSALDWLESEGIADAERWLAYAGGAPLRALELARGENADALVRLLDTWTSGQAPLFAVNSRESLEFLVDVLQKRAYDMAFAALTGRVKYGLAVDPGPMRGGDWLAFAREMGRNRRFASRPLNPGLFAAELAARYEDLIKSNETH